MPERLPNIVLVVFDTARWDRFGCYGGDPAVTPFVDTLAEKGLVVRTMVANGPWTLPSHGSLFTGLYPSEHGAQWQTGLALDPGVPVTLAEWLRSVGYTTVCATVNRLISHETGLARGFQHHGRGLVPGLIRRKSRGLKRIIAGGKPSGDQLNRWIASTLEEIDGPVFLFVNYMESHWPYIPSQACMRRVPGPRLRFPHGIRYRATTARSPSAPKHGSWETVALADPSAKAIYATMYSAAVLSADRLLAELFEILRTRGVVGRQDTLVMVTSDHGEHIGEHGLADHHASLDDHLTRVPFVAWGPGLVPHGEQSRMHEFVDVFPSIRRFLGWGTPVPELPARRRTSLFSPEGVDPRAHPYAFAEWRSWGKTAGEIAASNPSFDFAPLTRDLVSIRDERFKLVRAGTQETLFDMWADSGETRDAGQANLGVLKELSGALESRVSQWRGRAAADSGLSRAEELEIESHLQELGYL